jgi:hypothetical protein
MMESAGSPKTLVTLFWVTWLHMIAIFVTMNLIGEFVITFPAVKPYGYLPLENLPLYHTLALFTVSSLHLIHRFDLILSTPLCPPDRLCGLVARVPGYRSRAPQVRFPALPDFLSGLKRCPLSLISTFEELLGRNSNGSGLETQEYGHGNSLR